METKTWIGLLITATVGVILIGSLLAPILSDVTNTSTTEHNDWIFSMDLAESDPVVIEWDGTTWYTNGIAQEVGVSANNNIVVTGNEVIRSDGSARGVVILNNLTSLTLTLDNGTATINYDMTSAAGQSKQWTYTKAYYLNNAGEYVWSPGSPTTLSTEEIYVNVVHQFKDANNQVYSGLLLVEGTTNALTATAYSGAWGWNTNMITFDDVTANVNKVNDVKDGHVIDSITVTYTFNNGSEINTNTITLLNSEIVPKVVTMKLSEGVSDGQAALLNAMPVILILALIVGVVGSVVIRNRAD